VAELEQVHLTLHFLGGVEEDLVGGLKLRLAATLVGVKGFEVTVKGVGAFPSLSRARVLWAGIEDQGGRLLSLEQRLGRTLSDAGLQLEDRPFSPHLSLARTRRQPTGKERTELQGWMSRWRDQSFGRLPVEDVLLMRSQLGSGPAKHTIVERFGLE
jgi:2'-5' RNA ligase